VNGGDPGAGRTEEQVGLQSQLCKFHVLLVEQVRGAVGGGEGELLQKAGLDVAVLVHSWDGAHGIMDEGEDPDFLYQ